MVTIVDPQPLAFVAGVVNGMEFATALSLMLFGLSLLRLDKADNVSLYFLFVD